MLVLSRKQGESIVIAGEIEVNVIDIGRGRVQLGVSAPAHMSVHREEIQRRILQQHRDMNLPACSAAKGTGTLCYADAAK